MQVAIYGSGGLGAYYGARLQQAGHNVTYIARGAHLAALNKDGLTLHSTLGDAHLPQVNAVSDDDLPASQDAVLVAVKTWQLDALAPKIKAMLHDDTIVVPFLNGVEASEQISNAVGIRHTAAGLSRVFSFIESPGVIRHVSAGAEIVMGLPAANEHPSASAALQRLHRALGKAGVETSISTTIERELWQKLIMVSCWGGLGALTHCSLGELSADSATHALMTATLEEGQAVAASQGIEFGPELSAQIWSVLDSFPRAATTSLSRDIIAAKPSELDAWHGIMVKLATAHGIAVPNHHFIYHALQPVEQRSRTAHGLESS